jgi:hypothetical protein
MFYLVAPKVADASTFRAHNLAVGKYEPVSRPHTARSRLKQPHQMADGATPISARVATDYANVHR